MNITVICVNDGIEYAFVGEVEKARIEAKIEELARKDYERCKWNVMSAHGNSPATYEEYRHVNYWHTHTIVGEA